MFPRWKYSLFQRWFRRTLAFQKPLAFFSEIINCFTNIFDSKQLKYSPKVYIFALRRENGNSRRNEPLFLVSVDKLPCCRAPVSLESSQYNNYEIGREAQYLYLPDWAGFGSADYSRRPPREDPMHEKTPWARVVLIEPDLRLALPLSQWYEHPRGFSIPTLISLGIKVPPVGIPTTLEVVMVTR
jgi:hypothetical protein